MIRVFKGFCGFFETLVSGIFFLPKMCIESFFVCYNEDEYPWDIDDETYLQKLFEMDED